MGILHYPCHMIDSSYDSIGRSRNCLGRLSNGCGCWIEGGRYDIIVGIWVVGSSTIKHKVFTIKHKVFSIKHKA